MRINNDMAGPYYASTTKGITSTSFIRGMGSLINTDAEVQLQSKGLIDIVSDFTWSASDVSDEIVKKMPKVMLVERRQELNSTISSALYYLNAAGSVGGNALSELQTKLNTLVTGTNANASVANAASNIASFIQSNATSASDAQLLSDSLRSYIGIYYTKPTGLRYVLPYLGDNIVDAQNSFAASAQEKTEIGSAIETAQAVVNEIAHTINLSQPGSYIERPKHYQYPTEGKSITVTFPLVNTYRRNNKIPYQQNYELIWILAFQNRPFRTSFSRIMPPKIYTLTIPGQEFFPYCYISNMTVNFNGTRRLLPVTLPTGSTVDAPIPESYIVSITFTSLLANIANTMITGSFASKVRTGTSATSFIGDVASRFTNIA